jgi:hypothetical protein
MPPAPQSPQLLFAANGTVLLHATAQHITAWDLASQQKRYTCAARLLGLSQSSATLVAECAAHDYCFLDSASGAPQVPTPAMLADLPFEVRFQVTMARTAQGKYQGQWIDITGQQPPRPLTLHAPGTSRVEQLDNWLVVAPDALLACAWSWADGDFDGAYGRYHALQGSLATPVSFAVSRFHTVPPLYFSGEHDWLVSGEQSGFNLYTASTGQPYGAGKFYRLDGGGDVVAFHPQQRYWLAVNRDPILHKDAAQQGFVLLDIQTQPQTHTKPHGNTDSGREIQVFPDIVPVVALAFHPDGQSIAALHKDGTIHGWETDTGRKVWSLA